MDSYGRLVGAGHKRCDLRRDQLLLLFKISGHTWCGRRGFENKDGKCCSRILPGRIDFDQKTGRCGTPKNMDRSVSARNTGFMQCGDTSLVLMIGFITTSFEYTK